MTVLENKINIFINDIYHCLDNEIYHGALTIALTLPDICSNLISPNINTRKRCTSWFNDYVKEKYVSYIGPDSIKHIFLDENDAYALRCAFLHQGETNIEKQRARKVLNDFAFISPRYGGYIHCNKINDTLQLQIDLFCKDIIEGAVKWIDENKGNEEVNQRAKNMMIIGDEILI